MRFLLGTPVPLQIQLHIRPSSAQTFVPGTVFFCIRLCITFLRNGSVGNSEHARLRASDSLEYSDGEPGRRVPEERKTAERDPAATRRSSRVYSCENVVRRGVYNRQRLHNDDWSYSELFVEQKMIDSRKLRVSSSLCS